MSTVQAVAIRFQADIENNPIVSRVAEILQRRIADRCGAFVVYNLTEERKIYEIEFALKSAFGLDAFAIEDSERGVRIIGGNERALLYGAGQFLRTSEYSTGVFTPSQWRGKSSPQRSMRGMYFATHAFNWYETAPDEEIEKYVEDIALWGINAIAFAYFMDDFTSPEDPRSLAMVERLKYIARCAKRLGLEVHTLGEANEGYSTTPEHLRAEWSAENGYFAKPIAWFHAQVCPSKPGGRELIFQNRRAMLELFRDVEVDGFWYWPYDQGGCTCADCTPWGANGYLKLVPDLVALTKEYFPQTKIVLSAWEFDHFTTGEFEGLRRAFCEGQLDFVDYIMLEEHQGKPHPEVMERGVPGDQPLLGFPEISMWGIEPWGGYGAISCPEKMQRMWDGIGPLSDGGFPYSEGLYEDVHKAICARFYWDDQPAIETMREYCSYEFGTEAVVEILCLLEKSFSREIVGKALPLQYKIEDEDAARAVCEKVHNAAAKMPPWARRSWRWRLIELRAIIDSELAKNDGYVSQEAEEALNELTEIYHYVPQSNYCMDPQRIVRHGKRRDA